jgi:hypothetical protein
MIKQSVSKNGENKVTFIISPPKEFKINLDIKSNNRKSTVKYLGSKSTSTDGFKKHKNNFSINVTKI